MIIPMTDPTAERLIDKSDLEHGLTQAQILELFSDQGEFPNDNGQWQRFDILTRKALLATEWLASFWKGPIPDWIIAENADMDAIREAFAKDAGIENISPIHGRLHDYFKASFSRKSRETFDKVEELALKVLVDAGVGANTEQQARIQYAQSVLEREGEVWNSPTLARTGVLPQIEFPLALVDGANASVADNVRGLPTHNP